MTSDSGFDAVPSSPGEPSETSVAEIATAARAGAVPVTVSLHLVWRIGLVLLGVVSVGLLAKFIISDAGNVILTVLMSWFAALAMTPIVDRLAIHMRRGVATALVMGASVGFVVIFVLAFGSLFVDQLAQLILLVPTLIDEALAWANDALSMSLTTDGILSSLHLSPDKLATAASSVGAGVLTFFGSAVGSVFGLFTFGMFTFYLSAQLPQLERWVAGLFPARRQAVAATVWTLTIEKTGSYVGARVVLAVLNSVTTAVVFVIIGMPYWLPLALWTGIVAQFVPTIGTYISIILPVMVGLLSPNPMTGVIALVWAIVYQQMENLFIEPRVNSKAVNVNPAVSFGAVLVGAALFGVVGAFLAVPVVAILLALLQIYGHRHELLPDIAQAIDATDPPRTGGRTRRHRTTAEGAAPPSRGTA
jgi:predicted PurR-regulated permease PerM